MPLHESTELWFLSAIQYYFHKLKYEVHLIEVSVTVGTGQQSQPNIELRGGRRLLPLPSSRSQMEWSWELP